ncbi:phosphate ABC transporter permease subunit PstC [Thermus thalpophilus]|uniref:phosphate ABC transporter permease subunit PstC n=1 Tax=Thermus sp. (strain 2.9) TaxID=1577051 RepID=UPI000AFC1B6F|nr:phosphate ABC transporter permease subunit PstC [Thermus sp. 2.9]
MRWLYTHFGDRIFAFILLLLATGVMALALLMAYELYRGGSPVLHGFGLLGFALDTQWDPVRGKFGAWPYILGTLIVSLSALFLSFFPALATAIFVAEYAPKWLAQIINFLLDLMAAVPSVVYGLWGIFVLAPWLRDKVQLPLYFWASEHAPALLPLLGVPTGYGLMSAILILASMVVPYTAALARDAIALVPKEHREAAYALGATHWEVLRLAILPLARGGILAGAFLALGRAVGETMAVTMVIGNSHKLPYTIFGGAATMPSVIANEFTEAVEDLHLSALIAVGFLLFLVAMLVNFTAAYVLRRQERLVKGAL